jgi:S-adenosylmethionine decarboxylase
VEYSCKGTSITFDTYLKHEADIGSLLEHMRIAINKANMHIVEERHVKFEPQGDTVVFILSESAFTLHSYPEKKYYSFDIYTCGDADPSIAIEYLKSVLDIDRYQQETVSRGNF